MTPEPIRFHYRGNLVELDTVAPTRTVLQVLREDLHCTGTKEGCAEGDCGACTVVVGELRDGAVELKTVNACIQFAPTLDGKALFTVEDLKQEDGTLHPVQKALVDCHGSQCGFCTPGFAMSLWGMYVRHENADPGHCPGRAEINDALSGNLCRCTGYQPIIDAARQMFELPRVTLDRAALADALLPLQRQAPFTYADADGTTFHAPRTLDELVALRCAMPQARILAGSTDVGLWVTKQMRALGDIIHIGEVAELRQLTEGPGMLEIGAAVSLEQAYAVIARHYPELRTLWQRFASLPVRNAGTLGGNVANGSPIGDSMPWMIALGAEVVLNGALGRRTLALDTFYLAYQKNAMQPGEFLEAVRIPLPEASAPEPAALRFRTYKLSKRFDQDISAVCAAFALTLDGDLVSGARIAFGGMAATPKRATGAEQALTGKPWNESTVNAAMDALDTDYEPLSDMRASADYRKRAARNLLRRFWLETRLEAPLAPQALDVFAQAE